MSTSMDKQAFFEVCAAAKPANSSYVSLYIDLPYYGGPQEGGWWGSDTELVAYHECATDVEAKAVAEQVHLLAERMSKEAADSFNRACAAECEWLEARGLDSDFLPEVDGEERYWVTTEQHPGQHASEGSRYYE